MKRDYSHVYAIIRVDEFQGPDCPVNDKVAVKEIVWTEAEADQEVDRLNSLPSKPKETYYYSQVTRLVLKPAEPQPPPAATQPGARSGADRAPAPRNRPPEPALSSSADNGTAVFEVAPIVPGRRMRVMARL